MKTLKIICTHCHKIQPREYGAFCEYCNQMTNIVYDLKQVKFRDSENPYLRFFDLLPVKDIELLPKGASYTPTIHAKKLGAFLKMPKLYLKNETTLPTGSTKFRNASVTLAYLYENGIYHFCTSSTGNSSSANAHCISDFPEMKMSLFTSADFRSRVNYTSNPQIDHYILKQASFAEAAEYAGAFAKINGLHSEGGFYSAGRKEGLKLAFFEAYEQVGVPIDWYVQAISSGLGVYGVDKGAKELMALGKLAYLPHLLCVQQESCSPQVKAWKEQAEVISDRHIVHQPQGIAKAILRGNPSRAYPYMRKIVQESAGDFTAVSDREIRETQQLVQDLEGIEICFASSAAVAGLIKSVHSGRISPQDCVLISLTGRDRHNEPVPDDVTFLEKDQWEKATSH